MVRHAYLFWRSYTIHYIRNVSLGSQLLCIFSTGNNAAKIPSKASNPMTQILWAGTEYVGCADAESSQSGKSCTAAVCYYAKVRILTLQLSDIWCILLYELWYSTCGNISVDFHCIGWKLCLEQVRHLGGGSIKWKGMQQNMPLGCRLSHVQQSHSPIRTRFSS